MILAIIMVLYVLIILFDFIPSIKKDDKKVIWIYAVSLIASFSFLLLYSFKIPMKSLSEIITKIFSNIV
ncbi:MAG: hypothetical protein PHD10_00890 [Bacilli bacterium]|nr:hypothetical protein [Bacilli bacterium]MDD4607677.1 hypothetical protein [Bacilli bacterium]